MAAIAPTTLAIPPTSAAPASTTPIAISAALNSSECSLTNVAMAVTNGRNVATSVLMPGTSVPVIHPAAVCAHSLSFGPCACRNLASIPTNMVSTGISATPMPFLRLASPASNDAVCCAALPITSGILAVLAANFCNVTSIMPACTWALVSSSASMPNISEALDVASASDTCTWRLSMIAGDRRPTPLTRESIKNPMSVPVAALTFDR